jgi:glycosyltransferase involved in cell wall biosynthesis
MAPDPRIEGLWNVPKGSRIITAGSLDDHKDHALLIRAFAQVTKHRDARLMILGAGSLRGELENLCGALGVGDQVLFPGFVADPWPYLFSASTFALSSKYEGYALVIVEAMHAGLKIVSTDCPSGPAELLQGGRYGTLVGVGDEDALAKALLTALDESSAPEGLPQRVEEVAGDFVLERYAQLAGAVER